MGPRSLLARLEVLEGRLGDPSGAKELPWKLVESRDGGQTFTDDEGRGYTRVDLDQLAERWRLVIVKIPDVSRYVE